MRRNWKRLEISKSWFTAFLHLYAMRPRPPAQSSYRAVLGSTPRPSHPLPSSPRSSSTCSSRRNASSTSRLSAWTSALPTPSSTSSSILTTGRSSVRLADPLKLLGSEMGFLRDNVSSLLGSSHPTLDTIAKYYFQAEGKHVRPMIVLLMSQATNGSSPLYSQIRDRELDKERLRKEGKGLGIDEPINEEDILQDENPSLIKRTTDFLKNPLSAFSSSSSTSTSTSSSSSLDILPTQRRLAEITELIHVASLLHDDVIDVASTRRGAPSAPNLFGNKLSILAGDFLLARASLALSRLGSNEVVELVASVLANLVEGEVMQMKGNVPTNSTSRSGGGGPTPEIFQHYMRKTYLKTASLIAKSTRATTVLGGCGSKQGWVEGEKIKDAAYNYGKNLGIAFQVC